MTSWRHVQTRIYLKLAATRLRSLQETTRTATIQTHTCAIVHAKRKDNYSTVKMALSRYNAVSFEFMKDVFYVDLFAGSEFVFSSWHLKFKYPSQGHTLPAQTRS